MTENEKLLWELVKACGQVDLQKKLHDSVPDDLKCCIDLKPMGDHKRSILADILRKMDVADPVTVSEAAGEANGAFRKNQPETVTSLRGQLSRADEQVLELRKVKAEYKMYRDLIERPLKKGL